MIKKNILQKIPIGEIGTPDDVAYCVEFRFRTIKVYYRRDNSCNWWVGDVIIIFDLKKTFINIYLTKTIKSKENMSDIADRVKNIVVEHLGVEKEKVVDEASFVDDLGADSLDTVELVMAFEEEFNIEIPDDVAEKITTIKDATDHIEKSQN